MKIENFCCVAAELQNKMTGTTKMSQIYYYRAYEEETLEEMLTTGFFNAIQDRVKKDDMILLYEPNTNDTPQMTWVKVVSNIGGVVTISEVNPPAPAQEQADWTEADSTAVSYIKNKPSEGVGISFANNTISIDADSSPIEDSTKPITSGAVYTALSNKQDTLVSGTNIKTINNNSILGSGNLKIDSLPSQTGHAGEYLTTDGTNASWADASTYHPTLFSWEWSDCLKNDAQWLRADTFSWQDGSVYEAAYNHLLNDIGYVRYMIPDDGFNNKFYREPSEDTEMYAWTNQFSTLYTASEFPQNGDDFYYHNQVYGTVLSTGVEPGSGAVTPTTETVGSYTITFYEADDGHKIVLADQETTVQNIYAESGVAWYYVIDTVNEKFKLPRTKFGVVGLRGNVGDYVPESLPNIKGKTKYTDDSGDLALADGAFYNETISSTSGVNLQVTADTSSKALGFNASRSSSTYQDSAPVQQRATEMYLYFYVGSFTQTALENTAGLNAELFNDKVDRGHEVIEFQAPAAGNNYTWYRKYADGWVEQGGSADFSTTSGTVYTINLPITMADTNYTVIGTPIMTSSATGGYSIGVSSRSTTQVSFRGNSTNTVDSNVWNWEVKGMGA